MKTSIASGNVLYIGGNFTHMGFPTGPGVPIDAGTGQVVRPFPPVEGPTPSSASVFAAASDGAGGWFIGGYFTSVGGLPRLGLAHILADNTVSDWNPGAIGGGESVEVLVVNGSTVYVGGRFSQVGGNRAATSRPWMP